MRRLVTIFVWILALYALGSGQSEATKVDEFGKVNCDDFLARADNFFIALNKKMYPKEIINAVKKTIKIRYPSMSKKVFIS